VEGHKNLLIFDFKKCRDLENRVKGHSKVIGTDTDRSATYDFLLM